ncbi:PHP domain-containing protein [Caldicellulosiruptor danielii]|uniref:PHP domain-containing protein n=1 Tax=Anaerocellum danielii TaxID=1387557 RepID=A0ABZ0U167_9FIRM|nr:PHP domain-containing protein [Caldicellulosiruptor danielii]WPX09471.1 PHP domain-containing protein [Caldicellulosiruptor danielii]
MAQVVFELEKDLNHENKERRLETLSKFFELVRQGKIVLPPKNSVTNNHIHTFFSFSPYSPSKAIYMAAKSGLPTAGIMDHDTIAGSIEFICAGKIAGIATTIGVECRADFSKTLLSNKKINNPDQHSIAYVAIHGIPHNKIETVMNFFKPYIERRMKRNRLMVENINNLLSKYEIALDFEKDVVSISKYKEGGTVTERHILFALAKKLIERVGKGKKLINFLKDELKIEISKKVEGLLSDEQNPFYEYDLLGLLKSDFTPKFYINATDECPDIKDVVEFSKDIGAILAYAYLGDVIESVTGDKRSEKFEDDYLELLFEVLNELGIKAVTYMPSRNTLTQLKRVKYLCDRYNFLQISGEDINSPRPKFYMWSIKAG